jgi:hypothetical protein
MFLVRKTFLVFCDFLPLKMYFQSNKQKNLRSLTKIAGSASASEPGSISQRYGSLDPDPYQNLMDPQHCRNDF